MNDFRAPRDSRGWLFLLGGSVAMAGGQWLTLWVLARSAPPEVVGAYALVLSWILPLFAFASLQLRGMMATDPALDEHLGGYAFLRLSGGVAAFLALAGIWLWRSADASWFPVLASASVPRFAELLSDFRDGQRHRERNYLEIGVSQCCRTAATLGAFVLVWLLMRNLVFALLASGVGALGSALFLDLTRSGRGAEERLLDRRLLLNLWSKPAEWSSLMGVASRLLLFAAPLAMVGWLNSTLASIPRLLLERFAGLEELATFACLVALLGVPSLLSTAYCVARAPEFADSFLISKEQFVRLMVATGLKIGAMAAVVVAAMTLVGPLLLPLVFGETYQASRMAIFASSLFVAIWSLSTILGTAATAARWVLPQLAAFAVALPVTVATGFVWIPNHGVEGAAFCLIAGAVALFSTYVVTFAFRLGLFPSRGIVRIPSLLKAYFRDRSARFGLKNPDCSPPVPAIGERIEAIRVLHVTCAMNVGGVERWLLRLLDAPLPGIRTAILAIGNEPGEFAPHLEARGIPVYCLPATWNVPQFLSMHRAFLKETGPWDVVHSHVGRRSALVLLAARFANVPGRVSHGHHGGSEFESLGKSLSKRCVEELYAGLSRWVLRSVATTRLACAKHAAEYLYGHSAGRGRDFEIIRCGLDFEIYRRAVIEPGPACRWGTPLDAIVIAHAGRFVPEKNHTFLVDVARELTAMDPRFHFVLAGDGPLRSVMEQRARDYGIEDHLHFLGNRADVISLLIHGADAFFLPSLSEGLSVALVEAQVAGLPCFYSSHLAGEADLFPQCNEQFCISESPESVATQLRSFVLQSARHNPLERIDQVSQTPFSVEHNRHQLRLIYERALSCPRMDLTAALESKTLASEEATVWKA